MQIAWVYPINRKCGISIYSKEYIDLLSNDINIVEIDSNDINNNLNHSVTIANKCDAIHIQYETTFFYQKFKNNYLRFIRKLSKPILVSLHEVYENFPGVFPKSNISGLLAPFKRFIYDFRHPIVRNYEKHLKKDFGADEILAHHEYQRSILNQNGIDNKKINILSHAIDLKDQVKIDKNITLPIKLISTGFINKNYNYSLLISSLEKVKVPWTFTWIGGIREDEDTALLQSLKQEVSSRKWDEKFKFTGWLSDTTFLQHIMNSDIALHLYSNRSSSSTLCNSFSVGIPIIATRLPLTIELSEKTGIILVDQNQSDECANVIDRLAQSPLERISISNTEYEYSCKNSYTINSLKLLNLYKELIK